MADCSLACENVKLIDGTLLKWLWEKLGVSCSSSLLLQYLIVIASILIIYAIAAIGAAIPYFF